MTCEPDVRAGRSIRALGIWLLAAGVLLGAQSPRPDQATVRLPSVIPIFPLPEAMLFPKATRPLHVFEARYRAMVADALQGDRIIGMVTLRPGYEASYEGRPPIFPIGCAGVISDVERLSDGRYNIVLRGLVKFRVVDEDNSRSYRLAHVVALPEVLDAQRATALKKQRERLATLLSQSMGRFGLDRPPADIPDDEVVDVASQYLEVQAAERQVLLEQDGSLARSTALIELLEEMLKAR